MQGGRCNRAGSTRCEAPSFRKAEHAAAVAQVSGGGEFSVVQVVAIVADHGETIDLQSWQCAGDGDRREHAMRIEADPLAPDRRRQIESPARRKHPRELAESGPPALGIKTIAVAA